MNEVTRQVLGIVGLSYKGDYSSSTKYVRGNVVVYDGSSYVAKTTTTGNLPTNTTYFQLIARKPIKGVDYFTEEDIQAIVDEITLDAESEFNQNVEEKTAQFNQNATDKTDTFNSNATSKTGTFNDNATSKTTAYNTNASDKTDAYNLNASNKTTAFDGNASDKTTAFNNNATSKTGDFDSNATLKTTAYNDNHTSKLGEYNTNATNKLDEYNANHTNKLTAYNENAEEKVDEFDEHVDEIEERIEVLETVVDGLPHTTETGTDVSLKNTIEGPLKTKLSPSELEQFTTTGRNLFNSKITNTTASGATVTYNESTQEITINGTCTAQTDITFVNASNIVLSESTTLYSKIVHVSGSGGNMRFEAYTSSYGSGLLVNANDISSDVSESTTRSNTTYSIFRLRIYASTFDNHKFKFYMSTVSNVYEPYTGANPSPSPDYSQEIKKVWGDNTMIISNNNLLESQTTYSTTGGSSGGVAYTRLDSFTPVTSPITLSASYKGIAFVSKIKKGLTYTFSSDVTNMTGTTVSIYEKFEDMIDRTKQLERFASATFTPNYDGYALLCMYSSSSSSRTHSWTYGKLELGTVATDYVPHEGKKYPLNLGVKNLFDKNNATYKNGYYINTSGVETTTTISGYTTSYVEVKPNTKYYISGDIYSAQSTSAIYFYNSSKQWLSRIGVNSNNTRVFTTPSDCKYIQFQYVMSVFDADTVQIEEGEVGHSYSEYGVEPVEYCEIGDYKDEFFYNSSKNDDYINTLEDGKWYLKKNTKKYVFDGNIDEEWSTFSVDYEYQIPLIIGLESDNNNQFFPALCDKYINHNVVGSELNNYEFSHFSIIRTGNIKTRFIRIRNNNITTLEGWKVELQSNNLTVYIPLATSEYILLNDTLQQQLTDISKMLSYNEETNISQENEELPFQISASALRDINSMFESLETRIAELETE